MSLLVIVGVATQSQHQSADSAETVVYTALSDWS